MSGHTLQITIYTATIITLRVYTCTYTQTSYIALCFMIEHTMLHTKPIDTHTPTTNNDELNLHPISKAAK